MKKYQLFAASAIALVYASPSFAQTAAPSSPEQTATPIQTTQTDTNYGDDIVITATKREQTLQDVPISVSVTSAAQVEQAHIVDLKDLQSLVPSLKVTQFQSAGQTNFTIRGFGNGNGNDGIESSVGVFIDGVYRSRSQSALDDLPEIERVEVLRGPQSTLFGKNVSAGAISIVTKKPSFTWGGKAEISVGNYGLINPKATITGPISDTLAFRLSGSVNQRDGYFTNTTTHTDVNGKDRYSLRGDLLFEPSSDFSIRILADVSHIDEVCCGATTIFNGPATQVIGLLGFQINDTSRIFDRNLVYNTAPNNRLTGKGISGQIDWDIGPAKLTSITSYRDQKNDTTLDVDFTGADISNETTSNDIKTFTQEFRLASDGNGPFNWLIGAFYDHENLRTGRDIRYGKDARAYTDALSGTTPAALVAALGGPLSPLGGAINGRSTIYALEFLQHLVTPSIIPGGTYFQPGQGIADNYTMKQDSYSIFGQVDYKIGHLTLTAGGAYLNDRKAATSNVVLQDPFSSLNLQAVPQFPPLGLPGNIFGPLGALQFFYGNSPTHGPVNFPNANESGVLKGDKFTYAGRAAYDLGPVNVYFSYSTGWKAGAFNLSSDSRPPLNGVGRSAGPENVTVYEAGAKAKFRGGYFNLAVFKQTIKGFQSNAFTGLGFNLVNAGQESVRGVEVDAAYRPISWLALTGSLTYLDPRYDSFTMAPCVDYDTVRCPINPLTGRMPDFRDISGQTPAGISKWNTSVSATINHSFSNGWGFLLRGEYDYASSIQLTETTPPQYNTYDFNTVNASFSIQDTNDQLELMFWVRNLTKDNFLLGAFPTVAQTGSYSGYPNEPRTYGVTLRKSF